MGTIFSLNNWPGHLSYVLIAIAYWLTDMFWLLAVVGLSLETAQLSSVSSGDLMYLYGGISSPSRLRLWRSPSRR
jgi:hypothetical protein